MRSARIRARRFAPAISGAGFTAATLLHSSGTPTYSPPEYLAGKAFTVQGDAYSLGVMIFFHESKTKRRTR